MRGVGSLLVAALLASSVAAAPRVSHDGQAWTLENNSIQVQIDAQGGRYRVLDKTAGYLWRAPDKIGAPVTPLLIPQLPAAPVIDGDIGDWGAHGQRITHLPNMLADARKVDGPSDLSSVLRIGWDSEGLYVGGLVRDDVFRPASADDAEWWYKDSIEFWINARQYAIRFGPWGANFWSAGGRTGQERAAFRQVDAGYVIEFFLPAAALEGAVQNGPGAQLRFALGINDCDGDDGRQGQLYYPASWAHSSPETFAQVTLTDPDYAYPLQPVAETASALTPLQGAETEAELSFRATAKMGNDSLPVTLTFRLEGDGPDLLITCDTADRQAKVGRFAVLHPLVLDRPNGRIIAATYCNGIGVRTDDMSWRGTQWATWAIDMPWVGVTDGELGYMLLWELPVSCDNGAAVLDAATVDGATLLAPGVYHHPIMGQFGEPRTVRYSFCASGGHVAICKRYRDYAARHGFLVTQREKMRTKPELAKLAGAPDVWGRSDLAFCSEAKAAGIDRLMVNGAQKREDMERITRELGFLMSTYDNYEDAFEGDEGRYGDFVEAEDVVMLSDGARVKAWLTKGDNPKQFMKRCSELFERVSRTWVPKELALYPYNARFIDVTTATHLQECYHPKHTHTRSQDREVKRNLAKYQGNELNLVLGGEHGRWWGADIFNYWEGMQSGGFYSWPAGHVGMEMPETRDAIGQKYLDWGLGETNRYPLWELVFHDCVVSTWYWGDSTGHLNQVAPELDYKKDAFNILYGTVPLYWVAQPYSYNWREPAKRERMLESYRNTCKLHEVIGFEEMVSHEFVTDDRAVQHTVFGDGTNVWVNFGEKPWTLEREGKQYVLPQYGFYVKGPRIEQYRLAQKPDRAAYRGLDEVAGRVGGIGESDTVTCIRSDGYLFVQGDVPGLVESFLGFPVTVRREGPARLRINAPAAKWVRVNWKAVCPEAGEGDWRLVQVDKQGKPAQIGEVVKVQNGMLLLPEVAAMGEGGALLIGPSEFAQITDLSVTASEKSPEQPIQGDELSVKLTIANTGGKPSGEFTVAAYLGKVAEANRLAAKTVSVPAEGTADVVFTFPSDRCDGLTSFVFRLDEGDAVQELCETNNTSERGFRIAPNLALWDARIRVTVDMAGVSRWLPTARMPFDLQAEWQALGLPGEADPGAIRVMTEGDQPAVQRLCTSQYDAAAKELQWRVGAKFDGSEKVRCTILLDSADKARHQAPSLSYWHGDEQTFHSGRMVVRFEEGYIKGVSSQYPFVDLIANLGVSSKDTGWVDEVGEVQSFEVVQDGPLFTQIRVKKSLRGNHSYEKLYTFYWDHFFVTTLSPERFGTLSRAYYLARSQYEDDKGLRAVIDGQGDAENVSGRNANPKWYATWPAPEEGKAAEHIEWGLSCVAVTPHEGLTYWDAGSWAGLGFESRQPPPVTVGYFLHNAEDRPEKAPDFAALDYERAHNPVIVTRD